MHLSEWQRLADILVNYSTKIKKGDKVQITMMEADTFPLARAVYAEVIKAGGLPNIEFQSAYLERDLMLYGSDEQLDWVPDLQSFGMDWADAYIGLRGARNPHEFSSIPAQKIVAHKRAMGTISAMRNHVKHWVLVRVPNESFAQQAETSMDEMMSFFFNATLIDWEKESVRYGEIKEVYQNAESVRILGKNTDLRFSTRGRKYIVADGHFNMPDGEIFTSPIENSLEGKIYFEFPGVYAGQMAKGINLQFSSGKIVKATADTNEQLLNELINMDAGAQFIGEFGVGLNYGVDRFCSDILFDEKIGGTIHLAIGRGFEICNGTNHSSLHWDLIKDLRSEGKIFLDGKMVLQNGKYQV
ncbi:MAG: aminopeptidase [Anaerolineales bacterium]|nr:MAG: aminopeptidase [Anaerolineales bacterium]